MLTRELMGLFALAIMWTATLLIAAVALGDLVRLIRRRARVAPLPAALAPGVGAISGVVASPGPLATLTIEELGRARADRQAILFHPRTLTSAIAGGTIRLADGTLVAVPALAAGVSEVWRRPVDPPPSLPFAEAHAAAKKARGFARTLTHAFGEGDAVVVAGELRRGADGAWSIAPAPDPTRVGEPASVLVAAVDPRAWYGRKIALSLAGIAGILGSAALVTALAFIGPPFGVLTLVAGVLGLGQFLAAQPIGVALRGAVASPDRAIVHHDWAA